MKIPPASPEALKLLKEGSIALARVEAAGMQIDTKYLERIIRATDRKVEQLEAKLKQDPMFQTWERTYGARTKLGSLEQLTQVLFGEMKVPYREEWGYTPQGHRYRANEKIISGLDLPFCKRYLWWQKLKKKVRGTYLEGLRREVQDGFLHPVFNLHTTVSFRSSSDSINFQNIPVRNPFVAKIIRRAFIAREGRQVLELDFKGIEVVIGACLHKDPVMMDYINDPKSDMHRDQACDLFMLKPEQVDKATTRDISKNQFVFAEFYGSVYFQIAPAVWEAMERRQLRVGKDGPTIREHLASRGIKKLGSCIPGETPRKGTFEAHVKAVEDRLWQKFRVYYEWRRNYYDQFLRQGWFKTLTGFVIQAMGEKGAGVLKKNDVICYPIQGSAFHCLLQCLIWLQRWLTKHKFKTLIVGQIHDSMILDVVPSELQDVLAKAKEIMTVILLKKWPWVIAPMTISAEMSPVGGSWFDKRKVELP